MTILVTGGAGYIGAHTCVELQKSGRDIVIFDNFCNSHPGVIERIGRITGKPPKLIKGDIRDRKTVLEVLRTNKCTAVIHFAGLKAVGESMENPLAYYDNNVAGSVSLFEAMQEAGVKTLVFSSSATVYGEPQKLPLTEDHPLSAVNPYGATKLVIENILRDIKRAAPEWRIAILRYFNPVGAHESGHIGEDPRGVPQNLMPYVVQVAGGRRESLSVFGGDYATTDGTGVRDYIHVVDLAQGHLAALDYIGKNEALLTVNLGTGRGNSVLEVVSSFEKTTGQKVPYKIVPRRPGDVAACWADATRAAKLMGWKAERGLETMCVDMWRWQADNPDGYGRNQ